MNFILQFVWPQILYCYFYTIHEWYWFKETWLQEIEEKYDHFNSDKDVSKLILFLVRQVPGSNLGCANLFCNFLWSDSCIAIYFVIKFYFATVSELLWFIETWLQEEKKKNPYTLIQTRYVTIYLVFPLGIIYPQHWKAS